MALLNDSLKQHLIDSLRKGIRYDGRVLDEYRPIAIERDVTRNAEGSARVKLGDTEVIAGIKLMVGQQILRKTEILLSELNFLPSLLQILNSDLPASKQLNLPGLSIEVFENPKQLTARNFALLPQKKSGWSLLMFALSIMTAIS